jgi:AraC-like DNA-binding protein
MTRRGLFLSTDMVTPRDRNEFWREVARPVFDIVRTAHGGEQLEGTVHTQSLGSLMLGATTFNQQVYRREQRAIVKTGLDHYLLQLLTAGTVTGNCDGVDIAAGVGDICVFDLARPFTTDAQQGARLTVMIPRERIDSATGGRSLHGLVMRARDPLTRLLRDFILNLSNTADGLDSGDALAMAASITDFFAAALSRNTGNSTAFQPILAAVVRKRAIRIIDAQLSNPRLGPEMLMQQLRVSRAHLYRMFAGDGGISALIRQRRLDAAFHNLSNMRGKRQSIAEIARQLGFTSSGQFSRAFRARFAIAPRDARFEFDRQSDRMFGDHGLRGHFAELVPQPEV